MEPVKSGGQGVSFKAFRGKESWKEIVQSALDWMNGEINLNRILSITTVFCHANDDGLVTVYYLESQASPQHHSSTIEAEIIRDTETWVNHSKTVCEKVSEISTKFAVLSINDLEVNEGHEEGLTIIWYLRPKL